MVEAQRQNTPEKDPQEMRTLEWIFSKNGMLKALKDFRREAPVTAPILYGAYVVAAVGLALTFGAGPLGFPAVAAAGLNLGCAGALTCLSAMISFVAVSVGQEFGYFRKKTAGNDGGGAADNHQAPAPAPSAPAVQAGLAAKAAFNAESPKTAEQPAPQEKRPQLDNPGPRPH